MAQEQEKEPPMHMDVDHHPQSDHDPEPSAPASAPASASAQSDGEPEPPTELMVVSRARRSNAGNRMATLLAKSAQQEEEWGEEWEETANEEEFIGDDVNDRDDFNLESSSSEEEDGADDDDDTGEKELRKAERQERTKKRKHATNPFAARIAAVARKKVKLDVPTTDAHSETAPRPKKKSERASWIPTGEDGPVRTSSRRQTVAAKETVLAKLKEKDRRRDDTLAMMKAAEARKAKDEPKALTQAERLAEAARVERINSKSLHRWEEAEEQRAAERQAKLDALKNRQIEGPFIRYYSGPGTWVDDKLKFTGKDAPTIEELDEKLNKEVSSTLETGESRGELGELQPGESGKTILQRNEGALKEEQGLQQPGDLPRPLSDVANVPSQTSEQQLQPQSPSQSKSQPQPQPQLQPVSVSTTQPTVQTTPEIPQETAQQDNEPPTAAPTSSDSFLSGIEEYASDHQEQPPLPPPEPIKLQQPHHEEPPRQAIEIDPAQPNVQPSQQEQQPPQVVEIDPSQLNMQVSQPSLPPSAAIPPNPFISPHLPNPPSPTTLLHQSQQPPSAPSLPPAPPRRKTIHRALRNLLILSSFPNLSPSSSTLPPTATSTSTSTRSRPTLKDKDRASLIQLCHTLFAWPLADATSFVTAMLSMPKTKRERDAAAQRAKKETCVVTAQVARYRDPGTGIAYKDLEAFRVVKGVLGGRFVWHERLGCYVGARVEEGKESAGTPVRGVPKRFLGGAEKGKVEEKKADDGPTSAVGRVDEGGEENDKQQQQQQQQQQQTPNGPEGEKESGVKVDKAVPVV